MTTALRALQGAIHAKKVKATEQGSVDVAQAAIDLEARYLPPAEIEVARFHLHTQQLRVHAAANDPGGVAGEVAALEWIRDRLTGSLDSPGRSAVDGGLSDLRAAADTGNLAAAADIAARLAGLVRDDLRTG